MTSAVDFGCNVSLDGKREQSGSLSNQVVVILYLPKKGVYDDFCHESTRNFDEVFT